MRAGSLFRISFTDYFQLETKKYINLTRTRKNGEYSGLESHDDDKKDPDSEN